MADIRLSTLDDDIDTSDEKWSLVDGDDAIIQHILIRLRFFKGEWFLDPTIGIPYYETILLKNPDLIAIRSVFRQAILTTPGIASLDSLLTELDNAERRLTVTFAAIKTDGGTLDFSKEFRIA
jgi:hypothetical protein